MLMKQGSVSEQYYVYSIVVDYAVSVKHILHFSGEMKVRIETWGANSRVSS